jgi:hypothetical protein
VYYCGVISFSAPCGDGFFVIWELSTADVPSPTTLCDRDWWLGTFDPVCKVYHNATRGPVHDAVRSLTGTFMSDREWAHLISKLGGPGDDDSSVGPASTPLSPEISHGATQRTWVNSTGQAVCVTATHRRVEFLGRHRCKVEVDVDIKQT